MQSRGMKPNELVSEALDASVLSALIRDTSTAFVALRIEGVVVARYGYGSNIHPDLTYVPMAVGVSWLDRFVRESLEQRIAVPCESDFIFEVGAGMLEVEYCHHGHVHLSGTCLELVQRCALVAGFKALKFQSASQPGEH